MKHRNLKARTPLMRMLQKAWKLAISKESNTPADPDLHRGFQASFSPSRRKFLSDITLVGSMAGMGLLMSSCRREDDLLMANDAADDNIQWRGGQPRIAIIGAGMAGLNCAWQLKKNGLYSQIFEAGNRTGGRIYTGYGIMAPGLTTELGGEFIDSTHTDMLNLVSEFGLSLIDTTLSQQNGLIKDAYYFNGQHYSLNDVIAEFQNIAPVIQADIDSLPDTITYNNPGNAAALDNTSLAQYIQNLNAGTWMKSLLEVAYVTEYGLDAHEQSCINLLFLISTDTSGGTFDIFGESDERYKIAGGNSLVIQALTARVQQQIKYQRRLMAVGRNNSGEWQLTFERPNGSTQTIKADYVVMALPFTLLREVTFSYALPSWKVNAIQNLGYGTNAKLMTGFSNRPWQLSGYTGYTFTDIGFQSGWDNSELQPGTSGGFTFFFGGTTGVQSGSGTAASQAAFYLPQLNAIFPGASAAFNGNAERFHWPSYPLTKGSYACYKPGQWTTIAGAERKRVDTMLFAGEHCSLDFQGYMNGAAETGRKAAKRILNDLGMRQANEE